jgi:hypothetical protein
MIGSNNNDLGTDIMGHGHEHQSGSFDVHPDRMAKYRSMLSNVVYKSLLDQLQYNRSSQLAGQGIDHRAWFDFWDTNLATIHHSSLYQPVIDMGQPQKIAAYSGGFQHIVGMVSLHGHSTKRTDLNPRTVP